MRGTFVQSSIAASLFSTIVVGRSLLSPGLEPVEYEPMKADPTQPAVETSFFTEVIEDEKGNDSGQILGVSTEADELLIDLELGRPPQDQRVVKLENFLKSKGSPIAPYADLLVAEADRYGVDYRLAVGIAGLESGWCKVNYKPHNCWGYFTKANWSSYDEAIREYMAGLNKGYFVRGAKTPEAMGPTYAADPNWASRVWGFMNQID